MDEYGQAWNRILDYNGISTRREFWHFALIGIIIIFIVAFIDLTLFGTYVFSVVLWLVHLPPYLAVATRRLRDAGFSLGPTIIVIILSIIPLICVISIIFYSQPTKDDGFGDRIFGPPNKIDPYKPIHDPAVKKQASIGEYGQILQKIEQISELHKSGHISDDEYQSLKKSLMSKIT